MEPNNGYKEKPHLLDMMPEEVEELIESYGYPRYRERQLLNWVYGNRVLDVEAMTNLPKDLRRLLEGRLRLYSPVVTDVRISPKDCTRKYLLSLPDGGSVETVFIPSSGRNTICVSTQVGCAMGCVFCATGHDGFQRNLEAHEIVGQVLAVGLDVGQMPTNLVYMGMGEPLANYEAVMRSIRIVNHPNTLQIGARRITVSTCGLVPRIRELADEKLQITLAVSLHAATDELRNELMPVNKTHPLVELLEACRYYTAQTGRRVTFEYALLSGKNDSIDDARRLGDLLQGMLCHVNVIPANPVPGSDVRPPTEERARAFVEMLEGMGVPASLRKERGADIDAACGQLRRRSLT